MFRTPRIEHWCNPRFCEWFLTFEIRLWFWESRQKLQETNGSGACVSNLETFFERYVERASSFDVGPDLIDLLCDKHLAGGWAS